MSITVYTADCDFPCTFTSCKWKLIENIVALLTPFEELKQDISLSTALAAGFIPAITTLAHLVEKQASNEQGVQMARETLLCCVSLFDDTSCQKEIQ